MTVEAEALEAGCGEEREYDRDRFRTAREVT
jgi:hypothetical protein